MAGSEHRTGGRRRRDRRQGGSDALIAAVGHPLRRDILRRMADGRPATPGDLAAALSEDLGEVGYHVRVLATGGALRPTGGPQMADSTGRSYRFAVSARWVRMLLEEEEAEPV